MSASQQQTFRLYLLRHAQAGWADPGGRDFDRRLTEAGQSEAAFVASAAMNNGYRPDVVFSSAAIRCRETTKILLQAFEGTPAAFYLDDMYNAQPGTYLRHAFEQQGTSSVMLVGHNPTIEAVAEALLGRDVMEASIPHGFPTAGLAVLQCSLPTKSEVQAWRLIDFLMP